MTQWQPEHPPRRSAEQNPASQQFLSNSSHSYQQPQAPQFQPAQPWQPQPQYRQPRRFPVGIAAAVAVILLAGAGGVAYVLHSRSAPPKALTCAQQYQAWKTGPANADGKKIEADAAALSKAGQDIPVMTSDLKAMGADATALQAYPMPKCADPKGYWPQYLADLKAAGDNAGSASGLGGLILAEAPLKDVSKLQDKLTTELQKTAGVKPS